MDKPKKCFIFHKWNGCTCQKCGKVRSKGHDWKDNRCTICGEWNPDTTKCAVCGKTKGQFDREQKELEARMKAMGAGLFFGSAGGLMKCAHCGKIVCSKCAKELPGHDTKTCPFCGEDFGWGSVIG